MKLIIEIDEEDFNKVVNTTSKFITLKTNITESIKNGIPLDDFLKRRKEPIDESVVESYLKENVGHWIPLYDENGTQETEEFYGEIYKCSKCGRSDFNAYYCSYCGAKMDNGEMD